MTERRIPTYVDIARLCEEVCICERTADAWVRQGKLPAPRVIEGLKRWKWIEVQKQLRKKPKLGIIYFVQSGNFIKIGFTHALRKRIKQFRTGNPIGLKVIHTMPGTLATEAELLRRFSQLHHHGEWFRDDPELRTFLGLHLKPRNEAS